jgi:AraC-like DNA-binding protein
MKYEHEKGGAGARAGLLRLTDGALELAQDGNTCTIGYVQAGSVAVLTGEEPGQTTHLGTATAGSLLLTGRGCRCTLRQVGHSVPELVGCAFSPGIFHEAWASTWKKELSAFFTGEQAEVLFLTAQQGNRLRTLLELLHAAQDEPDCPDRLYLALMLHYIEQAHRSQSRAAARPQNDTVERICAYLTANYAQKLSLSEVAAQFYLSPYYLSRLFRRVTGQSIVDYINARRIEAARQLLEQTDLGINDVAEQTGFATAAHFRRVFRDVLGASPQQYRKEHAGRGKR